VSLASFSVRRRVTVTMIFLGVTVIGLLSLYQLPLDMFPKIEPPMVSVITPWLGASAKDVESKVTKPLEEQLAATSDLEELSSTAMDNASIVSLKFGWGTDLNEAVNSIRTSISQAESLMPDDVQDSIVFRLNLAQMPILILAVTTDSGDIEAQADFVEDNIVNELKRVDGVATVVMFNQRARQLLVDVDRRRLDAYGLSLQSVGAALRAGNLTLPAGTLEVGRSVYTIRAPGEFKSAEDVENVIVGQSAGGLVYVKDVAEVHLGIEDRTSRATIDGRPALLMMVQRLSGANPVDTARGVMDRIDRLSRTLPKRLKVHVVTNLSDSIVRIVGSLSETIWVAVLLVAAVVLFFLRRWRTSFIVVLSIPASLVAAFALLRAGGYSLNIISLASFSIAVGLVVDDSIVVIDNITRHVDQGQPSDQAAAEGASDVSNAVTAATLTNAAIFMPVLFVGGIVGVMFTEFAFVMVATLLASLAVALMLVPVLSDRLLRKGSQAKRGWFWDLSERFLTAIESGYGRVIRWALRNRKKVLGIAMGAFVASLGVAAFVGADFMPKHDDAVVTIKAELAIGTNVDRTFEVSQQIEQIVRKQIPETQIVSVQAGASKNAFAAVFGGRQGSNIATITVRVPPVRQRARSTFQMAEAIRPKIAAIPDIINLEVAGAQQGSMTGGTGKAITIETYSPTGSISELRAAARRIRDIMRNTKGAADVTTDLMDDNTELQIAIDRLEAARLGVPVASIASAVRTAMYGNTETRYRAGAKDIDLFLRLREEDRKSVADISNLTVPSMTGEQIRLSTIAHVVPGASPIEVKRLNQQRTIRVMADVQGRALSEVARDVENGIAAAQAKGDIPKSISTRSAGDVKEQRTMLTNLGLAMLLAILLVYMVMAAQFESTLDPFVVMFSVPFGITGALIMLPLTHTTLSMVSIIGIIMTVGIVVKNAIVLVDYINLMRDRGMSMEEAIQRGGERRLRPVLMTALAIVGGMLPLATGWGEGSEIWQPMAVAVVGGVTISTLVTLVLIPSVYALTDRWRKRGKVHLATVESVAPAPAR
jgi:hydrophobic/amphiphilic exporter-1 (mainly G- bacteria), HAE1 family